MKNHAKSGELAVKSIMKKFLSESLIQSTPTRKVTLNLHRLQFFDQDYTGDVFHVFEGFHFIIDTFKILLNYC
jgi:hypothetical protein